MVRWNRLEVACLAIGALAISMACRHQPVAPPPTTTDIEGTLLAPGTLVGRPQAASVQDVENLVANNSGGLVANNSGGLTVGRGTAALRSAQAVDSEHPVSHARVCWLDAGGHLLSAVAPVETDSEGAFLLHGVPIGQRGIVAAGYRVGGRLQLQLALAQAVPRAPSVVVDPAASLVTARAISGGSLQQIDLAAVARASAYLRSHPALLVATDFSSAAALAASFEAAVTTHPPLGTFDPLPAPPAPVTILPATPAASCALASPTPDATLEAGVAPTCLPLLAPEATPDDTPTVDPSWSPLPASPTPGTLPSIAPVWFPFPTPPASGDTGSSGGFWYLAPIASGDTNSAHLFWFPLGTPAIPGDGEPKAP